MFSRHVDCAVKGVPLVAGFSPREGQRLPRILTPPLQSNQSDFDARREQLQHRGLFFSAIVAAAQKQKIAGSSRLVRSGLGIPHGDAVPHDLPSCGVRQFGRVLLQLALGQAHQVTPPALSHPRQRRLADHPSVHHPYAIRFPVARLDLLHGRFHRLRVVKIPRKYLVAQRHPVARHHKAYANLLAVGPMIPTVPALRLRIAFHLAFKIRRGDVVEQQVILDVEQSFPLIII